MINLTEETSKIAAEYVLANIDKLYSLASLSFKEMNEKIKLHVRKTYADYLNNINNKYSQIKTFFFRSYPVHLYECYVPIGIKCNKIRIKTPEIHRCLAQSDRIIIVGNAGSGKSMLIKHLVLGCIKDKQYIPVPIELRELNKDNTPISEAIINNMRRHGFKMSREYIENAKKNGHFLFIFDGYDEIEYERQNDILKEIKELSHNYLKCPIVVSTRINTSITSLENFMVFEIESLDINNAVSLIQKLPCDEAIKRKFIEELKSNMFKMHASFLSNPLLLSIMLLTYGDNAEIPSKISLFYNLAYEALFQKHDAYKEGYSRNRRSKLDMLDFRKVFQLFSLQTYDKRLFKMPRTDCLEQIEKSKKLLTFDFEANDYLSDCLEAVCLLIEDGLEISFTHRSFQEYFVALYISTSEEIVQINIIDRFIQNSHSDNVIEILHELSPHVVEKFIFIKHLDALFDKIETNNEVTFENYIKYILFSLESVTFQKNIKSITFKDDYDLIMNILWKFNYIYNIQTIHKCKDIKITRFDYITEGEHNTFKFYPTMDNIDFNTLDILGNSFFLLNFEWLQLIYKSYSKMKQKYENSIKSIEELLVMNHHQLN